MSRSVFSAVKLVLVVPELELFQIDLQMLQGSGGQFQVEGGGALLQEGQGVRF